MFAVFALMQNAKGIQHGNNFALTKLSLKPSHGIRYPVELFSFIVCQTYVSFSLFFLKRIKTNQFFQIYFGFAKMFRSWNAIILFIFLKRIFTSFSYLLDYAYKGYLFFHMQMLYVIITCNIYALSKYRSHIYDFQMPKKVKLRIYYVSIFTWNWNTRHYFTQTNANTWFYLHT